MLALSVDSHSVINKNKNLLYIMQKLLTLNIN